MSKSLFLRPSCVPSQLFAILFFVSALPPALAATRQVTNLNDTGTGSLRKTISIASPGDTIEFAPALFNDPVPKTLFLTGGALTINKNLTIVGPGDDENNVPMLVLDGKGKYRIFEISSSANVTITGLTMKNGCTPYGGAVYVAPKAVAKFIACDFRGNAATGSFGGGAIKNAGTLSLDQCLVASNEAPVGGGIANYGQLKITRSLIVGNVSNGFGGGVFSSNADLSIESSTISGNNAGTGGGIATIGSYWGNKSTSVVASTISQNRSTAHAGGLYAEGKGATASIAGSIFAGNVVGSGSGPQTPRDLATRTYGKISSADYNIVVNSGGVLSPYGPHDQFGVDPLLVPLAYNGGRTQTYAIGPGSPAIDAGNPSFVGNLVATDQRGLPRASPVPGGTADVGAYEYAGPVLTCQEEFVFECQGAVTTGNLTATLFMQVGGPITVTWTVNGIAAPSIAMEAPSGETTLTHSGSFGFGSNTASVSVQSQSVVVECDTSVEIVDTTPPVLTLNVGPATIPYGTPYSDPGAVALDICDGDFAATPSGSVNSCAPGTYTITYTATDASGNVAVPVSRTVTVAPPVITVTAPPVLPLTVDDSETGTTTIDLSQALSIAGLLPDSCGQSPAWLGYIVSVLDGEAPVDPDPGNPYVFTLPPGQYSVSIDVVVLSTGEVLGEASFAVVSQSLNVVWPLATELQFSLMDTNLSIATQQQFIAREGESRWYKFYCPPGARVEVVLTNLPENYDLVVYSNIQKAYEALLALANPTGSESDQLLAILGAEFAPEAYSPEAYSPEAYSPEAYSPEAYSPEAYSPEAYSPEAYSPEAYSPEAYSPEAYSPEAYSPEAYSPEAYSPEAYSPEAYASAQGRSLVAFSASPGTASEGIRFKTYNSSGEFYVRVRGQNGKFSLVDTFDLAVAIEQNLCSTVTDFDTNPGPSPVVGGSPTSLFVWDSSRIAGTTTEVGDLSLALQSFAAVANGIVVDLATNTRVAALNAQATANPDCPFAKNLVAEAIRNLIQAYRTSAPSIADITLIGPDSAIPFFRSDDTALLASESNYFPPVLDTTHSQSALRHAQVLSQDRYGSKSETFLGNRSYFLPEAPVGRLVETATEVTAYLNAYAVLFNGSASSGVLPLSPTPSGLFVGYDFLADATEAISDEFRAGLGGGAIIDELVSPIDLPPSLGWTANDLRAVLLGSRHDIVYLAGHFSTSGALAADYKSRFTAAELDASLVDLAFSFFMSPGCHSGFNTVDAEAVPFVTEQPDWGQAFSRKLTTWISGTGYQYGDTDFIEYTERLHLEIVRELRRGTGPVTIGGAMVRAKNRYLAETPTMRGIHEKTLLQVALYGLPMVKLNLPGTRLPATAPAYDVVSSEEILSGPGALYDLKVGQLTVAPTPPFLTRVNKTLDVVGTGNTVTASYFVGSDGIVSVPAEPVRPLESFNVSRPADGFVRGIGFRGGVYGDESGFVPFTGAPATEVRGVHGRFETEVFYPAQPWRLNQIGELGLTGGISILNTFPAQFLSDDGDVITGTLRKFNQMRFSVFYSPVTTGAALANPPAINGVASDGSGAVSVNVAASEAVGVQEVWVTYTGLPGSPFHGSWQSLTLNAPAGSTRIGTWTGTIPLDGADPSKVCFIVQAANGIGSVVQNSNFGRYFKVGESTQDGNGEIGLPTNLTLVAPPTNEVYRETIEVQALLTDSDNLPVPDKRVSFRIGPVVRSATTNSTGTATASLLLNMNPDVYDFEAAFTGDADYYGSSANEAITIAKRPTSLVFESGDTVPNASSIVVSLQANDGTPLKERSILFVLTNGSNTFAGTTITDGTGRARVTHSVPTGADYQVTAYFGRPVTLPGPEMTVVPLTDPLYLDSTATAFVTIKNVPGLTLTDEKIKVLYNDKKASGASNNNRGHEKTTIAAKIAFDDPMYDPTAILSSPTSNTVHANIKAVLSGKTLVDGDLTMAVIGLTDRQWVGLAKIGGTGVLVNVGWNPPVFKSKLSDSSGPEISSINLLSSIAILSYKPVSGTYDTVITGSGGQVTVKVKNGRVKEIVGGYARECKILSSGTSAVVALPFALRPGDTFATSGSLNRSVTVTPGVNFFGASGNVTVTIDTPSKSGPLYNDTPAILEFELTLGTGSGETPFTGSFAIGGPDLPWTKENTNLRERNWP